MSGFLELDTGNFCQQFVFTSDMPNCG